MRRATPFAVAILALASASFAEDLSQRLPAQAGGGLFVELPVGSVELHQTTAPEVRVEAQARGLGASAVHFATATRGSRVFVTGAVEPWLWLLSSGPGVRLRIWVPRDFPVEIHSTRGPIEIEDLRGGEHRRFLAAR
jgi:hypothetical protein